MKKQIYAASTAVACLLSAPLAQAATIAFGSATDITADTDISTNGTSVFAINYGTTAGTTSIINGVTFTGQTDPTSSAVSVTRNDDGLEVFGPNGTAFANDNTSSAFRGLTTEYQSILQSAVFIGGNDVATVSLNGLTSGSTYEIQFFVNDSRNRTDIESVRFTDVGNVGLADATRLSYNTAGNSTIEGLGQFITGTFTADSDTQAFEFESGARQVNALQLREIAAVPEPSSTALLGLGALSLIIRRRR